MISSGKWLLQWEKKFWKFNHLYITICISDVAEERKIFEKYIWQRSLKIRLHVEIYNFINNSPDFFRDYNQKSSWFQAIYTEAIVDLIFYDFFYLLF